MQEITLSVFSHFRILIECLMENIKYTLYHIVNWIGLLPAFGIERRMILFLKKCLKFVVPPHETNLWQSTNLKYKMAKKERDYY